jgi:hypothetical protein
VEDTTIEVQKRQKEDDLYSRASQTWQMIEKRGAVEYEQPNPYYMLLEVFASCDIVGKELK